MRAMGEPKRKNSEEGRGRNNHKIKLAFGPCIYLGSMLMPGFIYHLSFFLYYKEIGVYFLT